MHPIRTLLYVPAYKSAAMLPQSSSVVADERALVLNIKTKLSLARNDATLPSCPLHVFLISLVC